MSCKQPSTTPLIAAVAIVVALPLIGPGMLLIMSVFLVNRLMNKTKKIENEKDSQ
jgi:hypothetical protein